MAILYIMEGDWKESCNFIHSVTVLSPFYVFSVTKKQYIASLNFFSSSCDWSASTVTCNPLSR